MIKSYKCPTCGYEDAVWLLRIDTSRLTLCENCYPQFVNKYSRINSFRLNRCRRRHHE